MEKETLFVTISSQKGGVGKSVLTTLMASYLYFNIEKNVVVIDCDYPQYSIFNMREDDRRTVRQSPDLQTAIARQFEIYSKKAYPIVKANPDNALKEAYKIIDETEIVPDIVFFDLPGTVNNAGIINLMLNMDYIFIPIIADKRILQSSLAFIMTVREYMKAFADKIKLDGIYMFWNKVDKREHTELYNDFNQILKEEQISLLSTELPDTKKFNKELSLQRQAIFRSTLFPPDKKLLRNSNLDMLIIEICQIIKL